MLLFGNEYQKSQPSYYILDGSVKYVNVKQFKTTLMKIKEEQK